MCDDHGARWMLVLSAHLQQLPLISVIDTVKHQRGICYWKTIRNFWLLTISLFYFLAYVTWILFLLLFFNFCDLIIFFLSLIWMFDLLTFSTFYLTFGLFILWLTSVPWLLTFDFFNLFFLFSIFFNTVNHTVYQLLISDEQKPESDKSWQQFEFGKVLAPLLVIVFMSDMWNDIFVSSLV